MTSTCPVRPAVVTATAGWSRRRRRTAVSSPAAASATIQSGSQAAICSLPMSACGPTPCSAATFTAPSSVRMWSKSEPAPKVPEKAT